MSLAEIIYTLLIRRKKDIEKKKMVIREGKRKERCRKMVYPYGKKKCKYGPLLLFWTGLPPLSPDQYTVAQ
jgi:hypothetical protein